MLRTNQLVWELSLPYMFLAHPELDSAHHLYYTKHQPHLPAGNLFVYTLPTAVTPALILDRTGGQNCTCLRTSPTSHKAHLARIDGCGLGCSTPSTLDKQPTEPLNLNVLQDGNPAKHAVRSLTMAVDKGECFGLLGPNGAGKVWPPAFLALCPCTSPSSPPPLCSPTTTLGHIN